MAEKVALVKPKFIKVKDIQTARSGYNVYAKVVSAESRLIETRDGKKIPMVDAVLADETGSAKAFFKGEIADLIEKDNVLAIRNGVKRFVKNHISLEIDLFGRVTLEKTVSIPTTSSYNISEAEHRLEDKPRRRPYDNRRREGGGERREDRPRPRRQDREGREDRPRRENREAREDRPRREDREAREDRPRREDREGRQDRPRREDREGRQDRPRREERREDKPREDRPREDRPRDNRAPRENRNQSRYNEGRRDNRNNDDRRRNDRGEGERRENYRRNDRDYDRTDRGDNYRDNRAPKQYQEKREENRQRRAPLQWNKIADTGPGEDRLNLNIKIISAQRVGKNFRCVIGDDTGISNAFLPDYESVADGEYVVLFNARSEVVKEHIEIQLDRRGRVEKSRREVANVNEEFNLSQKAWVPIE